MSLELNCNTNVVLKLDLGEKGGTRRIRLGRIWKDDSVSYRKLRDLIVEYAETDQRSTVVVTYKDEDGDTITISTDGELSDAFLQFVDSVPPILRATATVDSKIRCEPSPPTPPIQVVKLVDAIQEALSNALEAWPARRNNKKDEPKPQPDSSCQQEAETMAQKVVANLKPEGSPKMQEPNDTKKVSVEEEKPKEKTPVEEAKTVAKEVKAPAKEEKSKEKKEAPQKQKITKVDLKNFDKSFIHGRHTCDGCLVTPIVGIRYHAKNIPDYDLCEKCVVRASKQKVEFEPVQLDRDVPMQFRWKRRQARLAHQESQRQSFFKNQRQAMSDEEDAMKEAIRQSLLMCNIKPKKAESPKEPNVSVQTDGPESPKEESIDISTNGQELHSKEQKFDVSRSEQEKPFKEPTHDVSKNEQGEQPFIITMEMLEEGLAIGSDNVQVSNCSDPKKIAATKSASDKGQNDAKSIEDNVSKAIISTPSIEEGNMCSEEKVPPKDDVTDCVGVVLEISPTKSKCDDSNISDSSFAMDAEGNGDVAVAIGETLDKCAEEINAIVSEISKSGSGSGAMSSSFTSYDSALQHHHHDEQKMLDSVQLEERSDENSDAGDTILDSVPTDQKESENVKSVEGDWQVLDSSDQIQDEMIARAASLLGSILFSSQETNTGHVKDSEETFASFLSTESSVPSSVPSIGTKNSEISTAVLSRWDIELKQLHELGFLDDIRNVEVLEKLEAANIGVDSSEPVTVQQAVAELLAEKKD